MRRVIARRLRDEAGLTLVELLVAASMGVVLLGVAGTLVVSALKEQPALSAQAQNISTARWVLERLTRELRQGVSVDKATASSVSFRTYVRHSTCGSTTQLASGSAAILCEVTYTCTTTACSRVEANPGVYEGTAKPVFTGINSSSVFTYSPSSVEPTYVGVTLRLPNATGTGSLTISDGADLRNATLSD